MIQQDSANQCVNPGQAEKFPAIPVQSPGTMLRLPLTSLLFNFVCRSCSISSYNINDTLFIS